MSIVMVPANAGEACGMLESALAFLADADAAQMPAEALAEYLRCLERADAVTAVARGRFLQAFDAKDGHLADGQRTTRAWLIHSLRVTRGQAGQYRAVQALAREHWPLMAGLRAQAVTTSVALQLAQWTRAIPGEFRAQAEEILAAAAQAGAGLRELAQICAEIRHRTAPPDPQDDNGRPVDREPHHVVHRADGGRTSLTGLKGFCHWHHHVVLHDMGWQLTVHPDGTSQVRSPAGKVIRSHGPPPRPG